MSSNPRPTLHQSDLFKLLLCAKQYELERIYRLPYRVGSAAHIGTGVHAGVEANLGKKKHTGELEPLEFVRHVAASKLRERWEKEGVLLREKELADPARALAESEEWVIRLTDLHYRELAPRIKPVEIEWPWRLNLQGCSHDLAGTIDIVEPDAIDDTKTKSKTPSKGSADDSIQLTMYAFAWWKVKDQLITTVRLHSLVRLKEPKVDVQESTRGPVEFAELGMRLHAAMSQIDAGVFPPCDPSSWLCGPDHCSQWEQNCPHGRRRRVQVSVTQ